MSKFITILMLVWLVVLTAFSCYSIKAEVELLEFADFVLDDNLKNVIQSGGATFYVVDMEYYANAKLVKDVPLWQPIYVKDTDMEALILWKQKFSLMIRDFKNLDFQSRIAAAKADQYFKRRVTGMQERKLTPEQKARKADMEKRKRD